jgi:rhodanese-related sulfurtransferase
MSNSQITLTDFYKLHQDLAANEVILDVRGEDEFAAGHIPNALNIPIDQISERTAELKNFSKIYIHCKRGGRAKRAFESLEQLGLKNLVCIHDAGMDMWIESGYPVKK